jgi:hypothetical protein
LPAMAHNLIWQVHSLYSRICERPVR